MPLDVVLTAIQLLPARPEMADLRKIQHYATVAGSEIEAVSYLVKLYTGNSLPQDSLGVELYVGDQLIRQYFQFKNGIYFKVNDPQQLVALRGQEVRFRRRGDEELIHTGIRVPEAEANRPLAATDTTTLPTQAEALRE